MNTQTNKKGFTIIEVVLVLAIAALIFLMIFVALPALQRGQRDTARKNEAGTIASAVNTFRSNTRGSLPEERNDLNGYIDNLNQVTTVTVETGEDEYEPQPDSAVVVTGVKCGTAPGEATEGSDRQAAVFVGVENGKVYCTDV